MTEINVRKAMESLKLKNSEGHDRIPQRILIDGADKCIQVFYNHTSCPVLTVSKNFAHIFSNLNSNIDNDFEYTLK